MEIYVSTDVEADGPIHGPNPMLSFGSAAYTAGKELLGTFSSNLETLPAQRWIRRQRNGGRNIQRPGPRAERIWRRQKPRCDGMSFGSRRCLANLSSWATRAGGAEANKPPPDRVLSLTR